jgi:hypothetical protein
MSLTNSEPIHSAFPIEGGGMEMFGRAIRLFWIAFAVAAVISEITPAAGLPVWVFYSYKISKGILFFVWGYFTPLSFHRFNRLNRGLLLAIVSAAVVEVLQGKIGNGHRFSFIELTAKVVLISLGFVVALEARYQRAIIIGKWRIRLTSQHIPQR